MDELHRTVGDELFPQMKAKGTEPAEALRAKTTIEIFKTLYFIDTSKKPVLCSNYADLPPLDSARPQP